MRPTPDSGLKGLSPVRLYAESYGPADEVVDTIRNCLHREELLAASRLPSERELLERLGISRSSLREALSRLEALGIIEAADDRGRCIAGPDGDNRSETLITAWL